MGIECILYVVLLSLTRPMVELFEFRGFLKFCLLALVWVKATYL